MNEGLYAIRNATGDDELTPAEELFLYDYFNLCAEQYLYYRKGFIYPEVWSAWCNGMMIFFENPRIRALWEKESRTNSYYGFKLSCS